MFFSLGISRKSSMCANANPTIEAPWVSVYCRSTTISVQCRSTPSIIEATSEAEQLLSWEYIQTDFRSTCQ